MTILHRFGRETNADFEHLCRNEAQIAALEQLGKQALELGF